MIRLPASRKQKEAQVEQLVERFRSSQVIIWTDYRGLPTASLNELRRLLRPHGAEFHVIKNTMAVLALQRAGLPVPEAMLVGPTAASTIHDEISASVRALTEFASANRELAIKGGQANQRLLAPEEVAALVDLPSREVLLAQMLGGMRSPVSGLVNVLAGTVRGLVNVLQARARQMEEAGA
ncbi:MAG: 50S ribosomal protein L10 [Anaerolineae bacterium]|nr:50S ribosomal protein L10 [Anaerolineae bacterium]